MSADVIPFKRPEEPDPHCQGTAQCIGCGHIWEAVAPVGVRWLECGQCGCMKGTWRNAIEASPGDAEFRCSHCEGIALTAFKRRGLFYLVCMNCGIDHTEAVFG